MAAPMRDPPLDGGHRAKVADARAAPRTDQANNFEYDDNEWDLGITDLIIDLDADIEKTREGTPGGGMASAAGPGKAAAKMGADHSATLDKGLKMKIKRTKPSGKASEAKHEIVKSGEVNGGSEETVTGAAVPSATPSPATGTAATPVRRASGAHRRDKARDKHSAEVNGVAASPAPPTTAALPTAAPPPPEAVAASPVPPSAQLPTSAAPAEGPRLRIQPSTSPPPPKKIKLENKETTDVCVGTSVGTITEPDCLGPCEPGTSVTLEGIVWHETEGGVLVVNVTWRGKTYVGTLLDCTRHDWAPPRFCDSPTEELDARTPKGRGKRGRAAAPGDLSNFTETRSSVHSKLRNGGAKGRRGGGSGVSSSNSAREAPSPPPSTRSEPVSSPVSNSTNKRKSRASEEDSPASKRRTPASPPASPALLECPEPNCSKKYKHINGLKYHQSHAHGTLDDDEVKDLTSMSENDESNMEAPSPVDSVIKSPDKIQEPETPKKDERQETATPASASRTASPQPPPVSTPNPPAASAVPPVILPIVPPIPTSAVDSKAGLVKPGVLRFGPQEDFPVTSFISKPGGAATSVTPSTSPPLATAAALTRPSEPVLPQFPPQVAPNRQSSASPPLQHGHPVHTQLPISNHIQHPSQPNPQINAPLPQNVGPPNQQKGPPPSPQSSQFKVKPTAALMPIDDKKLDNRLLNKPPQPSQQTQQPNQLSIKKNKSSRKSPAGSPLPQEPTNFGMEPITRDEVQSPAYSDISDDTAPPMDSDVEKNKLLGDKKPDGTSLAHSMPPNYMYQFYGQSPYLMPPVPNQSSDPLKKDDPKHSDGKSLPEKDLKRDGHHPENLAPQKMLSQHYYPYSFIPPHGYSYNMDPSYSPVSMVPEEKLKEQQERDRERSKESPSPADHSNGKPPQSLIVPGKAKQQDVLKDGKHPNENHQILKESIEMKSQMSPYLYQRHSQVQRNDDLHRYYMYPDQQRRKENSENTPGKSVIPQSPSSNKSSSQNVSSKPPSKDGKSNDDGSKISTKEDIKPVKQEGQKPTMETTGPPPPPTSQYYLHPSYMSPSHYGAIPFDPIYRGGINPMLVSGPYGAGPYLHAPPMPRYHAPEDLSRPPPPSKALDLLQHHSQYYSSHKIHELQERALKSPTPKAPGPGGSPSGSNLSNNSAPGPLVTPPAKTGAPSSTAPTDSGPGKDSRSPPPQRHVHTHHHTHVGLGYPLYPAPYGAAVLASQQAAAVTVVNSFPPK